MGKTPQKSRNNEKPSQARALAKESAGAEKSGEAKTKKRLIIFAVAALAAIIVMTVVGLCVNYFRGRTVNYMKDNLSRYVHISREDYVNFPVEVFRENITEIEVEDALIRVLAANKDSAPLYGGAALTNGVMGAGDEVSMYYRGYTLDENGNPDYFEGGCNFADNDPTTQVIGSSTTKLYPGFELGLIGRDPIDYSNVNTAFEERTDGTVDEGDVLVVSYFAFYGDGSAKQAKSEVITLSEKSLNEEYGEGFREFLIGKPIGEKLTENHEVSTDSGITTVYGDITVEKAITVGKNPIVVTAFAPKNVDSEQIAGKTVYFEVYVENFIDYTVPEANDAFVTDKLGLTEADLAEYEGDSLIDKYRESLEAQLIKERSESERNTVEDALWERLIEKAEFSRLPKNEVKKFYDRYYNELYSQFESYSYAYGSFDEFAAASYSLEAGESWQDAMREDAESAVKEKLVFYYVIRQEGFVPSEEEFGKLYERAIEDHIVAYVDNAYSDEEFTKEQYDSIIKSVRGVILEYYGEEYFEENVYYNYAIDKMVAFADVTYK